MYFRLRPLLDDPDFSWIIGKNPASTFERDLSNQPGLRVVRASFGSDGWYSGQVHNDPLQFMLLQRERNDANYLDSSLHGVCPANLAGFATVLRSAMSGKNASPGTLTEEAFWAPKHFVAEVGPFPMNRHRAVVAFADVGVTATVLEEGTREAFTLSLATSAPVSTTEFVQKIYVVSYYLTCRGEGELTTEQLDRFVRLSARWLDKLECRDRVVKELCSFRKGKQEKFTSDLVVTNLLPATLTVWEGCGHETIERENDEECPVCAKTKAPGAALEQEPRLHDQRHALIKQLVQDHWSVFHPGYRIVDYGCAGGKLSSELAKEIGGSQVLGVDARIKPRARQRIQRDGIADRVTLQVGNLLHPDLPQEWVSPDALVLSEVIEHFGKGDRARLLDVVCSVIGPQFLVLTTPNREYNSTWGMAEGAKRHWDHKVEFDSAELRAEVMDGLRSRGYDPELVDLVLGAEVQPSFVVKAVRRLDAGRLRGQSRLFSAFHLDATNYTVSQKEIRTGAVAAPFVQNASDIFYLGPTMSPVDYDDAVPEYLEHPLAAFEYYRARGVDQLVAQHKYMGSRAYIAAVRDPGMAERFGLSAPCVVNSRSGMRFFDEGAPEVDQVYAALQPRMTTDLVLLDAEILPWSLKAGSLIRKQFTGPGETALLARKRAGVGVENAEKFCEVLGGFATDAPMEVRPFHVLATANLGTRGMKDVVVGLYQDQYWHMVQIDELALINSVIGSCERHNVNVNSWGSCAESITLWEEYCSRGGEGFVYKPADGIVLRNTDGYLRQPALKVRGRDYLRLIYGIDYLEKEWFDRLRVKGTKRKRILVVQQQELGERMLLAFLKGSSEARLRYAAAFLGVEDVNYSNIERTL